MVFPHGKHKEGIAVGEKIREKGYEVLFQAANTLAYSNEELEILAKDMNTFAPVSVSVVDVTLVSLSTEMPLSLVVVSDVSEIIGNHIKKVKGD